MPMNESLSSGQFTEQEMSFLASVGKLLRTDLVRIDDVLRSENQGIYRELTHAAQQRAPTDTIARGMQFADLLFMIRDVRELEDTVFEPPVTA